MDKDLLIRALIAAGAQPGQARLFVEPLKAAMWERGIVNARRIAAFFGQIVVESVGLTRTEENLYYTTPKRIMDVWPTRVKTLAQAQALCGNPRALANFVYSNREGNGDAASNNGWDYRGRGLIQTTFLRNYRFASEGCGVDYVKNPGLVALPTDAARTAAEYFDRTGCNKLADAGSVDAITRAVNGPAMLHAADRRRATAAALKVLEAA